MKIFHAAYNATESVNTAYDRGNLADAKITEYYTAIDNERTSQYNYDPSNFDDYVVMRNYLMGSCILSFDEFYFNYLNTENLCADESVGERKKIEDNYIDGKPLDKEVKWDIYCTTAGDPLNHYTYAVCLRELTITADGPFIF